MDAPPSQREQHRLELAAVRGELVHGRPRRWRQHAPLHDPALLELAQPGREDVRADAGQAGGQVGEPFRAEHELAHDEQRPALADEVERVRDSAELAVASHHVVSLAGVLAVRKCLLAFHKQMPLRCRLTPRTGGIHEHGCADSGRPDRVAYAHDDGRRAGQVVLRRTPRLGVRGIQAWRDGRADDPQHGQAHGGIQPVRHEGTPPHWCGYVHVEDLASTIGRVESGGGKTLVPATPIPDVGRSPIFADPQGAVFAATEPAAEVPVAGGDVPLGRAARDRRGRGEALLREVFGWTTGEMGAFGTTRSEARRGRGRRRRHAQARRERPGRPPG